MAYSSGDTLVRTVMKGASGLAADNFINDFAFKFEAGSPSSSDYANLFDAVDGFFNDASYDTDHRVAYYISPEVPRTTTHRIDMYHITTGALGSPIFSDDWLGPTASTFGSTTGLPLEVAGVLSFTADLTGILEESGATRPRARRRGRLYIGPLNVNAILGNTPPYPLTDQFQQTMRQAAINMHDAADADGWTWSVWSRTDAVLRPVVGGWTDNAPDTQRRRGFKASARVTYSV